MDLGDILLGVGFAFVFEGLLWGLFPNAARNMVLQIAESPENILRGAGVVAIAIGVFIVFLVRQYFG